MENQDSKPKRKKEIEIRDMYDLVERSLLMDTDYDQPHYIEVGKAQDFCRKYAEQEQDDWITITDEDSLPKEYRRVQFYVNLNHHSTILIGGYDKIDGWMSKGEKFENIINVTHWQPLVAPKGKTL